MNVTTTSSSLRIQSANREDREQVYKLRATIPPSGNDWSSRTSGDEPNMYPFFGGVFHSLEELQTSIDAYSRAMAGIDPLAADSLVKTVDPKWAPFVKSLCEFGVDKLASNGPLDVVSDPIGAVLDIGTLLGKNNKWKKVPAGVDLVDFALKRLHEEAAKQVPLWDPVQPSDAPPLLDAAGKVFHAFAGELRNLFAPHVQGLAGPHAQNLHTDVAHQLTALLTAHPLLTITLAVAGTAGIACLVVSSRPDPAARA
jgi:hypothetical protein